MLHQLTRSDTASPDPTLSDRDCAKKKCITLREHHCARPARIGGHGTGGGARRRQRAATAVAPTDAGRVPVPAPAPGPTTVAGRVPQNAVAAD